MISEYVGIIKIVLIVLDVICALILLRFVLKGLNRGFLRNAFTLGLVLLFIFLFTVGIKPILNKAVYIEIPVDMEVYTEEVNIHSIVETAITDALFDGDYTAYQKADLSTLIDDVVVSAVSWVVFSVLIVFAYILFIPITTLICKIFLPFLRKKEDGKKKKYTLTSKLLGLGCSLVRFVIFMFIFIVPLYGIIETGQIVLSEASSVDPEIEELSEDFNEGVGSSVVLKLTSNIGRSKNGTFGVGAKTFGQRLLIKTENADINIIKELDGLGAYLPRAIELSTKISNAENTNQMVACIEDDDVSKIINWLADSKIIKVAYPVGINIASNYVSDVEEIKNLNIDFDTLANIDINKDIASLEPFIIGILHCAKKIDLENIDVMTLLRNNEFVIEALDTLDLIFDLEITNKVVLNVAINYLNEMLKQNNLDHLQDLVTNDYVKNYLINDIKSIYEAFIILDENSIIEYLTEDKDITEFEITEQVKQDLEEMLNILFNLNLIKNKEQKIIQTVFTFIKIDEELANGMINENIDWSKELESVKQLVIEALELVLQIDFKEENYLNMLNNDKLVALVSDVLDIALNMQLTDKYILPMGVDYLNELLINSGFEELEGIISTEYISKYFIEDLEKLIDAAKGINDSKLLDYFNEETKENFVFNTDVKNTLTTSLKQLLDLKLIASNEKELISIAFSYLPEELLTEWGLDVDAMLKEDINWTNEARILVEVLVDALEFMVETKFDTDNLGSLLKKEEVKTLVPNLIDKVFTLEISEKYLAPVLIKYASGMLEDAGFADFKDYITVEYLKNGLSKDIADILNLYSLMEELGLSDSLNGSGDFNIDITDPEKETKFRTFVSTMLNLHILDGHESELVKKLCDLASLDSFIEYDNSIFDNVNWDEETNNFVEVVMAVMGLTGIENLDGNFLEQDNFEEVSDQLADVFDALINCSFTRDIAFNLVDKLTGSIGYADIHLTEIDKEKIIVNTGKVEFSVVTDLVKQITELFPEGEEADYTTLKGNEISDLMVKASDGVIASKIMGTVLNDVLGESGLDIMPKDEVTGLPLYDFTDQQTLEEQATNIANCIDLVNNLQSFDPDNTESISNIIDSVKALDGNGDDNLVKDLLTEFLPGESTEIVEDVNWSEEADLLEEVLNSYEQTENKEDFTIDDEELQKRIDESDFAGIILDYLNIFG